MEQNPNEIERELDLIASSIRWIIEHDPNAIERIYRKIYLALDYADPALDQKAS